jgi:hypothetical protein
MADDKTKVGRADRDRINVNEPYELRYWSQKFGVTPVRLKLAVARGRAHRGQNWQVPEEPLAFGSNGRAARPGGGTVRR